MSEIFLEILKLGGVSAVLLIGFKYTFLFNYRHSYNKKKYGFIKTGLENLQNLYSKQYENPTLPPYILQATVDECLTTNKYNFKLIFFLMNKGVINILDKAKQINKAWLFVKIKDLGNNKIELKTKHSLEKIRKWNYWCLRIYVFLSLVLLVAEFVETFYKNFFTTNMIALVLVLFLTIITMLVTSWLGSMFTSIITLKEYINFNARD